MKATRVAPNEPGYPSNLREQSGNPSALFTSGNLELLNCPLLGLFCSVRCPGDAIVRLYDVIRELRDGGVPIISGFHTPMEKECLTLLLRGTQPVVVCPARGIQGMRVPSVWKTPLADGRLLVLSPFEAKHNRSTASLAEARNEFVAQLADEILVAHAGQGSKTEQLCLKLLAEGKRVWTLDCKENGKLISAGSKPISLSEVRLLAKGS